MTAALREAAAGHGVTLTEHEIAVARAKDATQRINAFVDSMRKTGSLQVFNRHYKAARAAALARGESFMSYTAALGRLRSQIAARLAAGATCTLRG
jgi:hypothetical protein